MIVCWVLFAIPAIVSLVSWPMYYKYETKVEALNVKPWERVDSLQGRIEELEALYSVGGGGFNVNTDKKAVATWMREGTRGPLQAGEIKSLSLGGGSDILAPVRKAKDSQNQPVFQNTYGSGVDAGEGTLFGREVVVSEFMPDLSASPVVASILVGDFTAAFELVRIGQGSGFTLIRDQVTVKGQTKFYIAARYLGRPIINDAVKAVMR